MDRNVRSFEPSLARGFSSAAGAPVGVDDVVEAISPLIL
jgi:hypothetical protein